MRLQKVIIDGVVYYKEIDPQEDTIEIGTSEIVDEDFDAERAKRADEIQSEDSDAFFTRVGEGLRSFGEQIAVGVDKLGKKIVSGTERLFGRDKSVDENSIEAKLLKLLPYMDEAGRHDIFLELMENKESLRKVDLGAILPFFTKEDCDTLFMYAVENLDDADLGAMATYASEDCLSEVVDGYIAGKYSDLDINALYPYLAQKDIRRIFDYYVGR